MKMKFFCFVVSMGVGLILLTKGTYVNARLVPEEMWYCGIKLRFTPEARDEIQKKVDFIFENPISYQILVERADLYMPFINDAFEQIGVPEDLKYIVIQESGLRGDAVSPSHAVGFWQMKDFTAKEVGLDINQWVDERKHIFRSSIGAARYFHKQFRRFDNWLYAVIAYYTGGTGALPYVKSEYYGAREMIITEDLHWYAQKAIAHKIAFEPALHRKKNITFWLLPYDTEGEVSVKRLAEQHMLDWNEFKKYNLWVNEYTLPQGKPYSYYVPQRNKPYVHVKDPHINLFEPAPQIVSRSQFASVRIMPQDQTITSNSQLTSNENDTNVFSQWFSRRKKFEVATIAAPKVLEYPIEKEPLFGKEFDEITDKNTLVDIANKYNISIRKLRKWNCLSNNEEPEPGTLILLVKPSKAHIHIARKMETIADVAVRYKKKIEKLMEYNNIDSLSHMLLEGEKIYLRNKRPQDKYTIVYFSRYKRKNNKISGLLEESRKDPKESTLATNCSDFSSLNLSSKYSESSIGGSEKLSEGQGLEPKWILEKKNSSFQDASFETPTSSIPTGEEEITRDAAWNSIPESPTSPPLQRPSSFYYFTFTGSSFSRTSKDLNAGTKSSKFNYYSLSNNESSSSASNTTNTNKATLQPVGQPIVYVSSSTSSNSTQGVEQKNDLEWHEVKKGDTLWSIAQRFNLRVEELKKLNNLNNTDIRVGQKLKIKK